MPVMLPTEMLAPAQRDERIITSIFTDCIAPRIVTAKPQSFDISVMDSSCILMGTAYRGDIFITFSTGQSDDQMLRQRDYVAAGFTENSQGILFQETEKSKRYFGQHMKYPHLVEHAYLQDLERFHALIQTGKNRRRVQVNTL